MDLQHVRRRDARVRAKTDAHQRLALWLTGAIAVGAVLALWFISATAPPRLPDPPLFPIRLHAWLMAPPGIQPTVK